MTIGRRTFGLGMSALALSATFGKEAMTVMPHEPKPAPTDPNPERKPYDEPH